MKTTMWIVLVSFSFLVLGGCNTTGTPSTAGSAPTALEASATTDAVQLVISTQADRGRRWIQVLNGTYSPGTNPLAAIIEDYGLGLEPALSEYNTATAAAQRSYDANLGAAESVRRETHARLDKAAKDLNRMLAEGGEDGIDTQRQAADSKFASTKATLDSTRLSSTHTASRAFAEAAKQHAQSLYSRAVFEAIHDAEAFNARRNMDFATTSGRIVLETILPYCSEVELGADRYLSGTADPTPDTPLTVKDLRTLGEDATLPGTLTTTFPVSSGNSRSLSELKQAFGSR